MNRFVALPASKRHRSANGTRSPTKTIKLIRNNQERNIVVLPVPNNVVNVADVCAEKNKLVIEIHPHQ